MFAADSGAGELRQLLPALGDLTLAVEWALPELEFEDVRGLVGEPLRDGEERRSAGACAGLAATLSALIAEFETPSRGSGRGMNRLSPGRRTETLRRVGLTSWFSSVDMRCAGVKHAVDQIGPASTVDGEGEGPKAPAFPWVAHPASKAESWVLSERCWSEPWASSWAW
jgi:hypothetical protein